MLRLPEYLDEPLAWWSDEKPDTPAVTYRDRTWTWREWDERVRKVAGGLFDLGVRRGDVIGFVGKNHPACIELSQAAASLGAAIALINWRLAGEELVYVVNTSGATALFVDLEMVGPIEEIGDQFSTVKTTMTVTPDGGDGDEYETWLTGATPRHRGSDVTPDDVAQLIFSSGTSGRPKAIMLTHANLLAHAIRGRGAWTFDADDKSLVMLPLFHVGGWSYVFFSLLDGVPMVITREAKLEDLLDAIRDGASRTILIPSLLTRVLQSDAETIKLFGALKSMTYGAAPMPLPLLEASIEAWPHMDFYHVYGLTEMCGVITQLTADHHRNPGDPNRLKSAGIAIPGMEIRIVDPGSLQDRPISEQGEIWLRSDQLMKGYLNSPEETSEVIVDGNWYRTGDIGMLDDGGFLYIQDRIKDMIISGGENVYSPEVENVLAAHPAVLEAAVIGQPDALWGEIVKGVVALKPGVDVAESEIIEFCQERLAKYKCPVSIDIVEALPRNPTGKILKRELRDRYAV